VGTPQRWAWQVQHAQLTVRSKVRFERQSQHTSALIANPIPAPAADAAVFRWMRLTIRD